MSIDIQFEKNINNLKVIRETDSGQRREYVFLTLVAGLFVLGLFFYGWQVYQWVQFGYKIEAVQKKKQDLSESQHHLKAEVSSLNSAERIDRIARNQLGMVTAAPGQRVTFHADAPLTIPGSAPAEPQVLTAKK